jgi:thermostable 8-oxoguanine DNA glycosylase
MRQTIAALVDDRVIRRTLPSSTEELAPGVSWGRAEALFTPAFWATQAWIFRNQRREFKPNFRSGQSLAEEVAACILGGYGIRGELSRAAFLRLRERGLLGDQEHDEVQLEKALREPLLINGKIVRYRFPRAKARFLAASLARLHDMEVPTSSDRAFREALLVLPGIGLKTASWITRNWLDSNNVAILDVHVQRAGQLLGIFREEDRLPRDYLSMEERFLRFAALLDEPASILDLVIWTQMRRIPSTVSQTLKNIPVSHAKTVEVFRDSSPA